MLGTIKASTGQGVVVKMHKHAQACNIPNENKDCLQTLGCQVFGNEPSVQQGRSQKFVLGGMFFFWRGGGYKYRYPPPPSSSSRSPQWLCCQAPGTSIPQTLIRTGIFVGDTWQP